jgi:hypothetical protein
MVWLLGVVGFTGFAMLLDVTVGGPSTWSGRFGLALALATVSLGIGLAEGYRAERRSRGRSADNDQRK